MKIDKISKNMLNKKSENIKLKEIKKLLDQQTTVILTAVDEKISKMEIRFSNKIDRLIDTIDKFLKRLTDVETEFDVIKADINRMKKVIREKLGVELS